VLRVAQVSFLIDQQLPPALALWLIDSGHAADHVAWLGLERAIDDAIWREAMRLGAALVPAIHADPQRRRFRLR
jgi:predicted nuclease of predicted toxin-antitoxin system